ncbi:hypothetical protein D3C77_529040 [compost metagenome]
MQRLLCASLLFATAFSSQLVHAQGKSCNAHYQSAFFQFKSPAASDTPVWDKLNANRKAMVGSSIAEILDASLGRDQYWMIQDVAAVTANNDPNFAEQLDNAKPKVVADANGRPYPIPTQNGLRFIYRAVPVDGMVRTVLTVEFFDETPVNEAPDRIELRTNAARLGESDFMLKSVAQLKRGAPLKGTAYEYGIINQLVKTDCF